MIKIAENVLINIQYYIKVRDYMVNSPMGDCVLHNSAITLVIDKLDSLQEDYRKLSNDDTFFWYEYQFTIK